MLIGLFLLIYLAIPKSSFEGGPDQARPDVCIGLDIWIDDSFFAGRAWGLKFGRFELYAHTPNTQEAFDPAFGPDPEFYPFLSELGIRHHCIGAAIPRS